MRIGLQSMFRALSMSFSKSIQLLAAMATILTTALTVILWPSGAGNTQTHVRDVKGPVISGGIIEGGVHYHLNEDEQSHKAPATSFVVEKNDVHTVMDGQIEIVATKMYNSITGRGDNISKVHISVRIPRFRDYSFRGMRKGATKSFEFREKEYRLHMMDINLFDETARLNITGPF